MEAERVLLTLVEYPKEKMAEQLEHTIRRYEKFRSTHTFCRGYYTSTVNAYIMWYKYMNSEKPEYLPPTLDLELEMYMKTSKRPAKNIAKYYKGG